MHEGRKHNVELVKLGKYAPKAFEPTKQPLDGLITNDKFCLTRTSRLQLSWSRLPLSRRALAPTYALSDDVAHCGGGHGQQAAAVHVARAADRHSSLKRAAALGPGLSAPSAAGQLGAGRHAIGGLAGAKRERYCASIRRGNQMNLGAKPAVAAPDGLGVAFFSAPVLSGSTLTAVLSSDTASRRMHSSCANT